MLSPEVIRKVEQIYQQKGFSPPVILNFDSPDLCIIAHKLVLLYLRSANQNISDVHLYIKNSLDKQHNQWIKSLNLKLDNINDIKKDTLKRQMWSLFKLNIKQWNELKEEQKNIQKERIWNYLIESKVNLFEYNVNNYLGTFEYEFFTILTKYACIICNSPKFILKDEHGNFHSEDGAAIEFNNGFGIYSVHGVSFNKDLYESIYIKRNITPNQIVSINNTEQRVCAIDFFGKDKMIKELNANKIDEWYGESQITKMPIYNELYEFKIGIRTIRFVKVEDYSTQKTTILGVPVIKETETVMGAIAWTFGLSESEYHPLIES